jgi:hypothetical protein
MCSRHLSWSWMLLSLLPLPMLCYGICYFALVYLVFIRFMKKQKFSMAARFLNIYFLSSLLVYHFIHLLRDASPRSLAGPHSIFVPKPFGAFSSHNNDHMIVQ